jgi:hypothetical protein
MRTLHEYEEWIMTRTLIVRNVISGLAELASLGVFLTMIACLATLSTGGV